ncbi:MAG: ComEC/Rec2 family competence protein, partial [Candidatus Limnocylindrales bacterium]
MSRRRARPPTRWRPGRLAIAALASLVLALTVVGAGLEARPDGRIHITVLDVGQGDAILVEGDRGARMLIDGGPDPDRLIVELDARIPPWDRRIDVLILSHPHEDHAGGLPRLISSYRIGRVFEPGMVGPGPAYHAFRADLALEGRTPELLSTGDRLRLDSIALRVLWPDRDAVPRDPPDGGTSINNVSIVLLGSFGAQRFLLTGDIEQEIDPILLSRGLPRVDLLKVAHHGSRTSSTDAFLDAVRPKVAIVSVGAQNPYGHPAPATLERIEARGARLYRTDRNGSVEATLDGRTLEVKAEHGGPAGAVAATGGSAQPTAAQATGVGQAGALDVAAVGAFRCAIVPPPLAATPPIARRARPTGPVTAAAEDRLYHREDVDTDQGRGGGTAPLDRAIATRASPRAGRGRGRRLAGPADQRPRHSAEPS